MNAHSPVVHETTTTKWRERWTAFHIWKARFIEEFIQIEMAIAETLLALEGKKKKNAAVRLLTPHGQQAEELRRLIDDDGPFSEEGRRALAKLKKSARFREMRNMLCHGTTTMTVDEKGDWHAIMRYLRFKSERPCRENMAVNQREADALLGELTAVRQSLCKLLDNVQRALVVSARAIDSDDASTPPTTTPTA